MNELKAKAAQAALKYIPDNTILGVGTGSTVKQLIAQMISIKSRINACVASSVETEQLLIQAGFVVLDLNVVDALHVYIDGAEEIDAVKCSIIGCGGASTREKILASVSQEFIVIVDETKVVDKLGKFPVAVEVLPLARSFVARELVKMGGDPIYRQGFITDNNNIILDVYHLPFNQLDSNPVAANKVARDTEQHTPSMYAPIDKVSSSVHSKPIDFIAWEDKISTIPGVVNNGIFARRRADRVIVGATQGVWDF